MNRQLTPERCGGWDANPHSQNMQVTFDSSKAQLQLCSVSVGSWLQDPLDTQTCGCSSPVCNGADPRTQSAVSIHGLSTADQKSVFYPLIYSANRVFIKKYLHVHGPAQLRPTLFKAQLRSRNTDPVCVRFCPPHSLLGPHFPLIGPQSSTQLPNVLLLDRPFHSFLYVHGRTRIRTDVETRTALLDKMRSSKTHFCICFCYATIPHEIPPNTVYI